MIVAPICDNFPSYVDLKEVNKTRQSRMRMNAKRVSPTSRLREAKNQPAFLIPSNISCTDDIPKTYVYADNINMGVEIVDYLVSRLKAHTTLSTREAESAVRPFNATMSHDFRTDVMEQFRQGLVRILVCTDAAGMVRYLPFAHISSVKLIINFVGL